MSVIVRTFQTLGPCEPEEAFYSRAIAMERPRGAKAREGFSVGFYASTAAEAADKAHAWIEAERKRQAEIVGNRVAAAEKRRAQA